MRSLKKKGFVLSVFAVCLLLVSAYSTPVHADQVAELLALADKIQNETPGIGMQFWTEGDKTAYQISDRVVFGFTADQDCYLGVINIGTSGQTTLLFPNKWHPENKIKKGETYRIPPEGSDYAFKLMGPPGMERIKVIACMDPILGKVESLQQELRTPVEQSVTTGGTFLSMKNPKLVLKDIGFALASADASKWATVDLQFEVTAAAMAQPPASTTPSQPAQQ